MVKEATKKEFNGVIKKPFVVVDFWAEWCPPCKILAPILEELEKKLKNITFVKVDVSENKELALRFNIEIVPTLLIFKKGKLIDRIIGAVPLEELEKKLERLLD